MAVIFPPDNLHGKVLKAWYCQKSREITGEPYLRPDWLERPGVQVPEDHYSQWDMKDELL